MPSFISTDDLLQHWLGHRRVTRRMIEAFPEDQLFTFTIGGMRTFGALANEFIGMALPTTRGIISDIWEGNPWEPATTKAQVLEQWDTTTAELERLWPTIPASRWTETMTAFGQWEMAVPNLMLYIIDNEIHHRGQGYVYCRALGIEPPQFPDRS